MIRRNVLLGIAMSTVLGGAYAETYPSKPVTLVVPSAPAGSTDIVARLIGEQLQTALGQAVVIDNKPGGSGNIGTEFVARAPADGHTLQFVFDNLQSPHRGKNRPFNAVDAGTQATHHQHSPWWACR